MKPPGSFSRRALFRILAGSGLTAFVGRRFGGFEPTRPRQPFCDLDYVKHLLPQQARPGGLGYRYLEMRPEEANPLLLAGLLGLPVAVSRASSAIDLAALRRRLHVRHREDFRRGGVLDLEGWILSATELRLAALLHLLEIGDERGLETTRV